MVTYKCWIPQLRPVESAFQQTSERRDGAEKAAHAQRMNQDQNLHRADG
jgi:hypothetical protein